MAVGALSDPLPLQIPEFRPLLLALDSPRENLYAAIPPEGGRGERGEGRRSARLLVFDKKGALSVSFDLPGLPSGLAYDSASETLFVANAAGHEILIFDRFHPSSGIHPTRTLRKFNFPAGIYPDRTRLFVADAHPGALLLFESIKEASGERRPDRRIEGERSGLNGTFSIAADLERSRLYVSNFDGLSVFDLRDLSLLPERPLPPRTLARGLSFDPASGRLYIAAPMRHSYFVYEGNRAEEVKIEGGDEPLPAGPFPFSLAVDSKGDRLYLAGAEPGIGIIEGASRNPPEAGRRRIDRWLRWERHTPPAPDIPSPKRPSPGVIRLG